MERGSEWEYEAVRRQWTTLEHQRRAANRLVAGTVLGLGGVVLFMLAAASHACIGDNGIVPRCVAVTPSPTNIGLGLVGMLALGSGLWLWWIVFDE